MGSGGGPWSEQLVRYAPVKGDREERGTKGDREGEKTRNKEERGVEGGGRKERERKKVTEWGWAEGGIHGREGERGEKEEITSRRREFVKPHHSYPFELCTHPHAHVPACSPLTPGARQGTW